MEADSEIPKRLLDQFENDICCFVLDVLDMDLEIYHVGLRSALLTWPELVRTYVKHGQTSQYSSGQIWWDHTSMFSNMNVGILQVTQTPKRPK